MTPPPKRIKPAKVVLKIIPKKNNCNFECQATHSQRRAHGGPGGAPGRAYAAGAGGGPAAHASAEARGAGALGPEMWQPLVLGGILLVSRETTLRKQRGEGHPPGLLVRELGNEGMNPVLSKETTSWMLYKDHFSKKALGPLKWQRFRFGFPLSLSRSNREELNQGCFPSYWSPKRGVSHQK